MFGVQVQIVRLVDDWQPGFVEFQFTDIAARRWSFIDKVPVVTTESLDGSSPFPQPGVLACEFIEQQDEVVTIDTRRPWDVASLEGETRFKIHSRLVVRD